MVSRSDALQSHLNVLARLQRLLTAFVNLFTIVLVVIGKTRKKQAHPPITHGVVSTYRLLLYTEKQFETEVNDVYLMEE